MEHASLPFGPAPSALVDALAPLLATPARDMRLLRPAPNPPNVLRMLRSAVAVCGAISPCRSSRLVGSLSSVITLRYLSWDNTEVNGVYGGGAREGWGSCAQVSAADRGRGNKKQSTQQKEQCYGRANPSG